MFQSGLFAPKRSALDVIFTATGDFTAMPVARSHIYSYIWRFFGGGSVMNPAIWNQNGIDSGAESPESESIFSS